MTRHFRTFLLFAVLFAAWLLMSGHYTPLLITLGVVSCAGAALLAAAAGDALALALCHHDVALALPALATTLVTRLLVESVLLGETEDAGVVALSLKATERSFERLVGADLDADHAEGKGGGKVG